MANHSAQASSSFSILSSKNLQAYELDWAWLI
jgi:hypothetical protein